MVQRNRRSHFLHGAARSRLDHRLRVLSPERFRQLIDAVAPEEEGGARRDVVRLGPVEVVELAAHLWALGATPVQVPAGEHSIAALYAQHLRAVASSPALAASPAPHGSSWQP